MSEPDRGYGPKSFGPYDPPWLNDSGQLEHDDEELLNWLRPPGCSCCPYCYHSICNAPATSEDCIGLGCEFFDGLVENYGD